MGMTNKSVRWDENWQRLTYVLIEGEGKPLEDRPRCVEAIRALRKRYPQYVKMGLEAERHPVTELRIDRVHRWSAAPS